MCGKCEGRGRIYVELWSGSYLFKPCDCDVAKQNAENVMIKLNKLQLELQQKLKGLSA